ncbi:MAG: ATP-dependent zinc metalloprotease FtsH [bacterium]|nr:ATP-dependent zinc metalloprotease FtsH [bacterium]
MGEGTPLRPVILWLVLILGVLLAGTYMTRWQRPTVKLTTSEFMRQLALTNISSVVFRGEGEIEGEMVVDTSDPALRHALRGMRVSGVQVMRYSTMVVDEKALAKQCAALGLRYDTKPANDIWKQLIFSLGPVVLVIAVIGFLINRQMKRGIGMAMNFGRSRVRTAKSKNKTTFADLAGCDEAKEEVTEIVEYLKDPKKFQRLGGRIPRGVILIGPPGTGKTLLAKAIAGEADVPFFSISGSDFVEMFVGVGAARVRDLFEQGKRNAPCIIFVDEIDAVGRLRGAGLGGGHDEREQTLNALLVEMDGFTPNDGVIMIAATNRPDVLDPALLRPGRFDRQIVLDLPDQKGREEILKIHAKKVVLAADVDLSKIARGTPGFSGADLANLVNEAALMAARKDQPAVTQEMLEEARDKVRFGRERRSRVMDEEDRRYTAYHEAGHALVTVLIPECEPLHKVTIVPRGMAYLGATMQLPEKDKYHYRKKELEGQMAVLMGGRVAEELVFGDVTSGARNDIKHATEIARRMVCEWGMSDVMGPLAYGEREEHIFLGREIERRIDYSEQTAQQIDAEIRRLVEAAEARARQLIVAHRAALDEIAEQLLKREVLDGEEIERIVREVKGGTSSKKGRVGTEGEVKDEGVESVARDTGGGTTLKAGQVGEAARGEGSEESSTGERGAVKRNGAEDLASAEPTLF